MTSCCWMTAAWLQQPASPRKLRHHVGYGCAKMTASHGVRWHHLGVLTGKQEGLWGKSVVCPWGAGLQQERGGRVIAMSYLGVVVPWLLLGAQGSVRWPGGQGRHHPFLNEENWETPSACWLLGYKLLEEAKISTLEETKINIKKTTDKQQQNRFPKKRNNLFKVVQFLSIDGHVLKTEEQLRCRTFWLLWGFQYSFMKFL